MIYVNGISFQIHSNCTMNSTMEQNSLSWEDFFKSLIRITAQRSKNPQHKVGACIVNEQKRILGVGYNGMPNFKNNDDPDKWYNERTRGMYVCHAAMNAFAYSDRSDIRNGTMYITHFPCNECAKIIVQSGIKEVLYLEDNTKLASEEIEAANFIFKQCKVNIKQI